MSMAMAQENVKENGKGNRESAAAVGGHELKITRLFDAPRELVWQAWTESAMLVEWMGPRGFAATEFEMPAQVGARWRGTLEGPGRDGKPVTLKQHGTVLEVRPPELLRFSFAWDVHREAGLRDMDYAANTVTVELEEVGRKTRMTFTHGPFETEGSCDGHMGGWNSAFDKFAEWLTTQHPVGVVEAGEVPTELRLRRTFNAPRDLVFAAWTRPEMLAEWWGPRGFTNPRCEFEARSGGKIYIEMMGPDGKGHPMVGKVVEFFPPHRFHFTAAALDGDGKKMFENWNSIYFEEKDGKTEVTVDVHVMTATEVAPMYLKGMKAGWSQSLEKLAEFLHRQ
jgi:uncharacterized protein YndB with AHSA1/START domain